MRKLADLQFQSLYRLLELLRKRELPETTLQRCRELYETYYQCTKILFGEPGLTPYKVKLDMLLRIVKKGKILSPFYYMTEGTEKSHHTASKDYYSKTMRDGGYDARNMSSNYLDIQFSFLRAIKLCQSKVAMLRMYGHPLADEDVKSYHAICQEPIPEPKLGLQRTEDIFKGINFIVLGNYAQFKEFRTQGSIEEKITENGGTILNNTDILKRSKLSFLNHHYCVLPNRKCIDSFTRGDAGTTQAFYHTTLGNWTYISVKFILKCLENKSLLDPTEDVFEIDRSNFRRICHQLIAPQLRRQSQSSTYTPITFHTAMRKYKTALKRKLSDVDS